MLLDRYPVVRKVMAAVLFLYGINAVRHMADATTERQLASWRAVAVVSFACAAAHLIGLLIRPVRRQGETGHSRR